MSLPSPSDPERRSYATRGKASEAGRVALVASLRPGKAAPARGGIASDPSGEPLDAIRGSSQSVFVEEVGRRVRHLVGGPIEVVGAVGRVDRVAQGDLVRDDEQRLLGALQELSEGLRIAQRRCV